MTPLLSPPPPPSTLRRPPPPPRRSTVRGDLIRILQKLLRRRTRFDAVLIETTGLADPAPVLQTFFVDDELRASYSLDALITVVDAAHITQHLDDERPEGVENEAGAPACRALGVGAGGGSGGCRPTVSSIHRGPVVFANRGNIIPAHAVRRSAHVTCTGVASVCLNPQGLPITASHMCTITSPNPQQNSRADRVC
jgi:hypothetical protein